MTRFSQAAAGLAAGLLVVGLSMSMARGAEEKLGDDVFVDSDGVKIHCVTAGQGPLVVLLHGFPDYWYTWRKQMPELAKHFQVVAVDMRGYNESDQPEGVENYKTEKLVADVAAVVKHFGAEKATIVGHDWGGMVAWNFAMMHPEMIDRLVVLNLPHPKCLMRELATNPQQQKNSQYARAFQQPDASKMVMVDQLVTWVADPEDRKTYVEAMKKSSLEGMLNYYKANYPREPYTDDPNIQFPKVRVPVLMIHGLKDWALLPGALNDTWKYLDNTLTLITIPESGHFVQQDAADQVTDALVTWLVQKP